MSVLLIIVIALQVLGLSLEVWRHYSQSPAMFMATQAPEFRAKVADELTTRVVKINDHKVVGA